MVTIQQQYDDSESETCCAYKTKGEYILKMRMTIICHVTMQMQMTFDSN